MKKTHENEYVTFVETDEKLHDNKTVIAIYKFIILFIGSYGTIVVTQSCFQFPIDMVLYFGITLLFCFIPYILYHYIKHKFRAIIIILGIMSGIFAINYKNIIVSAIFTVNLIIKRISIPSKLNLPVLNVPSFAAVKDAKLGLTIVLFTFIVTMVMGYVVYVRQNLIVASLIPVSIILFSLSFDVIPSPFTFVLIIGFIFSVLSMTAKNNILINKKISLLVILLFMSTSAIIYLIIPKPDYKRISCFESIKMLTQKKITPNVDVAGIGDIGVGGINGGQLGQFDRVNFTNKIMFTLTTPNNNEDTYLKCFSGAIYGNNSWNDITDEDYQKYKDMFDNFNKNLFDSNMQSNILLHILNSDFNVGQQFYGDFYLNANFVIEQKYSISYENADKKYLILPYNNDYVGQFKSSRDGNYTDVSKSSYKTNNYYLKNFDYDKVRTFVDSYSGDSKLFNRYKSLEADYRKFVYDVYTKVPDDELGYVNNLTSQTPIVADIDKMNYIEKVKKYLADNYRYTLSPGKVPEGKDFVEYFLKENKEGYCSYFATVATLMFRAAGIPARYVEGYKVTSADLEGHDFDYGIYSIYDSSSKNSMNSQTAKYEIDRVAVTDKSAHAWVEIYKDGFGWVPVEVTPPANYVSQATTADDKSNGNTDGADPNEEEPQSNLDDLKTNANLDQNVQSKSINITLLIVLCFLSIICIALLVWFIIYHKVNKARKELFSLKFDINKNDKVINVYRYIEKITKFLKIERSECLEYELYARFLKEKTIYFSECNINAIIDIVLKAKFGNDLISEEELEFIINETQSFKKNTFYKLNWRRKFLFRFIYML